jgi:hypothetical protein
MDLGTSRLLAGLGAQLEAVLAALGRGALVARALSPWIGAALALAGVAALAVGARWRRPIAGVGGAIVGALSGLALHPLVQARIGGLDRTTTIGLGAAVVGGAGLFAPVVFPLVAGALPGALLARHVPVAGSGLYGGAIGALVGGALALAFADTVAALVASSLGAVLLGGALLALLRARPMTAELTARPFLLLAWIAILAIAGAAFQRGRAWQAGGGPRARRDGTARLEVP